MQLSHISLYVKESLLILCFSIFIQINFSFGQIDCDSLINSNGILNFNPEFIPEDISVGDEFCVRLVPENFTDLVSLQFTIGFDPSELRFVSTFYNSGLLLGPLVSNINRAENGLIGNVWFNLNNEGSTINDGSWLMVLCFEALKTSDECIKMELIESVIQSPPSEVNYLKDGTICSSNNIILNGGNELCIPVTCPEEMIVNKSICNSPLGKGSAKLYACGGVAPYDFVVMKDGVLIQNQIQENDFQSFFIEDLPVGQYETMVIDATGFQIQSNFEIEALNTVILGDVLTQDPRCANTFDGLIELQNIKSGNGENVNVHFSNGFTFLDVADNVEMPQLRNGSFQITFEDSKGCQILDTIVLNTSPIDFDIVIEPCCSSGFSEGYLRITPNGGQPFSDGSYSINGTFRQELESFSPCGDDAYDEDEETYSVRIEDANGCIFTDKIDFKNLGQASIDLEKLPFDFNYECNSEAVELLDDWYLNLGYSQLSNNTSGSGYFLNSNFGYNTLVETILNCEELNDVLIWIEDDCGESSDSILIDIRRLSFDGGGIACSSSCDTESDGCFTCSVKDLLGGFQSVTADVVADTEWPNQLCLGGRPDNISWFSFVAGGESLEVTIASACITDMGERGLESGIFDNCAAFNGQCVGGGSNCGNGNKELEYLIDNLEVGKLYYLYIDGCNSSRCEYDVSIEFAPEFILDTPDEVVIIGCESVNLPSKTFCGDAELTFDILHLGDSPTDFGLYDGPGSYDPNMCFDYFWTINPPVNGLSGEFWNPCTDNVNSPGLTFETVTAETIFEVCLTEIASECDSYECDDCCVEFIIKPLEEENLGTFDVCLSELALGWDASQVGWVGASGIGLDQVENAILNDNGFIFNSIVDTLCGCEYNQVINVNPVGSQERESLVYKMFDCQFRDIDNNLIDIVFDVNGQSQVLKVDYNNTDIDWLSASAELDWESASCDSLVSISVDTAIVNGYLEEIIAAGAFNIYEFYVDTTRLLLEHMDHPRIIPQYESMRWLDLNGEVQHFGNSFQSFIGNSGEYFVELDYVFEDVNFGSGELITCTKIFGPYSLSFLSSVEELTQEFEHQIVPNPNKGIFKLEFQDVDSKEMLIEVFTIEGKKIHSQSIFGGTSDINISNEESGTYFYRISGARGSVGYGRFIII